MDLRQLFGINDNKIDWKYPTAIGFALIIPQFILISFILIAGRLIIDANTGIFSNDFLYQTMIGIVSFPILVISLVILLNYKKIPIIISIILTAIFSRISDFILSPQLVFIILFILNNALFILLINIFIKRFKTPTTGLILAFLITTIAEKIFVNITYVFLLYRQLGIEMITFNLKNGVFITKLLSQLAGGLVASLLFSLGIILIYRLMITKNNKQYS